MPARQRAVAMNLEDLLAGFATAPALPVYGIASDSRKVGEGDLFIACAGERSHGIDYLGEAIRAGAIAVAYEPTLTYVPATDVPVPLIPVDDLPKYIGDIANRFFGEPSNSVRVTGVTGTNGKTTVAWLIRECYQQLGHRCGYVGTLGSGFGPVPAPAGLTTPPAVELHATLAGFREAGAAHAAIEVSSHALAQRRVDGVTFHSVVFTNLSHDHLDYHGDMQRYAASKSSLFTDYATTHRIINVDTEFGAELARRCGAGVIRVSTAPRRDPVPERFVVAEALAKSADGTRVSVRSTTGAATFDLPLVGDFNVANAALVIALLLADGIPMTDACDAMAAASAPPGRMQRVPAPPGAPAVYVDFAHTPAGLDSALAALRAHCDGALWCVFGCGGDRDSGKRPLMGRIAEQQADHVVLTSDNPRNEMPEAIIDDIISGFVAPENAVVIVDRAAAIDWTIDQAHDGDVVLIAGKGHEASQIIGSERRVFSDVSVAERCLASRCDDPETRK